MAIVDDTAVLDDLRKFIAKCDKLVAQGRSKCRKAHAKATPSRTPLETALNLLKNALEQIERTHKVIATSDALLETVWQHERHGADKPVIEGNLLRL